MSIQSYGNARAEIDAFAQGIHPRALTDGGLAGALPALTRRGWRARAAHHLDGEVTAGDRSGRVVPLLRSSDERRQVRRRGRCRRRRQPVQASDYGDGRGRRRRGADPSRGSGLRGLTDRFDPLGGWLSIESRRGVGTRLLATLPVEVDDVASPLPTSHVLVDCRPPPHASSVTGAWRPSDLRSDATTRSRGRAGAFRRTSKVSRERRSEGDPAWSP